MKAIETRYVGPTNTRGSRIIATAEGGNRVSVPYPHELSGDAVHEVAARALMAKMGWTGDIIGGGTAKGMAWVFVPDTFKADRVVQAKRLAKRGIKV